MRLSAKRLACAGVAGAAYAALTMVLYPISYGPVQFRIAEALCVLPFFDPVFAPGLFVGCAIANLVGSGGLLDVVFGSLATLCAGLCTAQIGKGGRGWGRCAAACAMPVLWNGAVIGAVLAASLAPGELFWQTCALYAAQVAGGEAVVLYALGLPLLRLLPKQKVFMKIMN